jgi:hypothetical protein
MCRHLFDFDGGEYLTTMGASWFVSYAYYTHIDKTHDNWNRNIETVQQRTGVFNRTEGYHKFWLEKFLEMDEKRLGKNKIGLAPKQVKEMAKELLELKKLEKEV